MRLSCAQAPRPTRFTTRASILSWAAWSSDSHKPTGSLCKVVGDIRAPRILIADGAVFKGNVDMDVKESRGK